MINKSATAAWIASLDVLRGVVILLMMLDHVRERFWQASKGLQLGGANGRIGGGFLTVGERLGMTATDFYLPGYTARIFGEVEIFDGTTLRLDVDNLFYEEFYTNSWADVWVEPGAPLRYRLSVAIIF